MKHRTMAGSDKREKVNKHLKELKIESCLLEMAAVCVCVWDRCLCMYMVKYHVKVSNPTLHTYIRINMLAGFVK